MCEGQGEGGLVEEEDARHTQESVKDFSGEALLALMKRELGVEREESWKEEKDFFLNARRFGHIWTSP